MKVHFVGYKPKWDEIINLTTEIGQQRIREIGAFSGAHGWARYNQAFQGQIEYERANTKTLISQIKQQQKEANVQPLQQLAVQPQPAQA